MFERFHDPEEVNKFLLPQGEYRPFAMSGREAEISSGLKRELVARGERYLGYLWPTPLAMDYRKFKTELTRQPYEHGNYNARRFALDALCSAEWAEGKGRFLADLANGIWAICDEASWVIPAHNDDAPVTRPDPNGETWVMDAGNQTKELPDVGDVMKLDLFSAGTAGLLADAYRLHETGLNDLSPLIGKRLEAELDRRIFTPFLDNLYWWSGLVGRRTNNWNPWIISNVLRVFGFWCRDEERRSRGIAKCARLLDEFLRVYYPDGGCDEGASYWNEAGGALFDCLYELNGLTGGAFQTFFRQELIRNIGLYDCRAHVGGPYFTNYADAQLRIRLSPDLIFRYGKAIDCPAMARMGAAILQQMREESGSPCYPDGTPHSHGRKMRSLEGFGELEAQEGEFPHFKTVWLPGIQYLALRPETGTEEGLYLSAKGGHNDESHNHNDVGSYLVFSDSHPAVADIGSGTYNATTFGPLRYTNRQMQSAYHNLPIVNGIMEREGEQYRARDVSFSETEEASVLAMDIAGAYPPEAGLCSLRRIFRYEKGGERILVRDEFSFYGNENTVEEIIITPTMPKISSETLIIVPKGGGRAVTAVCSGADFTAELVDLSDDPAFVKNWNGTVCRVLDFRKCGDTLVREIVYSQVNSQVNMNPSSKS